MSAEKMPDIAALERACLTAVPAQRVAFDGSFVVRSFLGGTGRANAASSLSPADDPELGKRMRRRVCRCGLGPCHSTLLAWRQCSRRAAM
jgi:hypothetical protein